MKGKKKNAVSEKMVAILTQDGLKLTGTINIHPYDRVSDFMQDATKQFVPVYDAHTEKYIKGGSKKTFIINKNVISWIEPRGS